MRSIELNAYAFASHHARPCAPETCAAVWCLDRSQPEHSTIVTVASRFESDEPVHLPTPYCVKHCKKTMFTESQSSAVVVHVDSVLHTCQTFLCGLSMDPHGQLHSIGCLMLRSDNRADVHTLDRLSHGNILPHCESFHHASAIHSSVGSALHS